MKIIILVPFALLLLIIGSSWILTKSLTDGSRAPDFTLTGDDNNVYTLSKIPAKRIVLYFYPRDNTPGCTKQACGIAEDYSKLKTHDIEIFGINYQSPQSHRIFKKEHNLPFILLSDTSKKVASKYGAYSWWHPMFPKRITIVIENGKIISIINTIDVNNHVNQILKAFNLV